MWYRKLTWKMIDEDVVYLSESSVYRILRENKLLGRVFKENDGAKKEYENKPERIHEHWHTDIAYVVISRIHYYLILMIDGFSRYLLSWELMTDMMALSVELFTLKTLEKYPGFRPKIIHDNGSQYISNDFKNLLLNNNCIDIPTRVRHPETNGKAERMIGLIRQEALRPNSPSYYEEARRTIEDYVDIYNNHRLHSGIKYLKPVDVFYENDKKILDERQLKLSQAKKKRIQHNTMINRNPMEVYSLNLSDENSRFV
jgi:putative transposase